MPSNLIITSEYFRQYRQKLGFGNQIDVKNCFGAKDILPTVDFNYIKLLNERLFEIADRLNDVVIKDIKSDNLDAFKKDFIIRTFEIMRESSILPRLNNQGRRPEQVYFSWMRGYVVSNFFLKALGIIFEVDTTKIDLIGDDDIKKIDTFKRTPTADLSINFKKNGKMRVEMQAGFTGINDIKQHKVLEAKKVFHISGIHTLAIHFDLYNGQVAFVKLDEIKDSNINWITRQQMEGQTVFNIDQNYFVWKITEQPVKYATMKFN